MNLFILFILTTLALIMVSALLLVGLFCYSRSSTTIHCLSVDAFEKKIRLTHGEQLIDVCYPREFAKNHIPGARNINFRSPDFREQISKLDRNKPILIYCLHGVRSKMTAIMCRNMGFTAIYDLEKGLNGWLNAKKAVEHLATNKNNKT